MIAYLGISNCFGYLPKNSAERPMRLKRAEKAVFLSTSLSMILFFFARPSPN